MKQLITGLFLALIARLAVWAESGPGIVDYTARAAVDLSAYKYRFVRLSAAGPLMNVASNNLGSSAAGLAAGVLQDAPNSGQAGAIRPLGLSKVKIGASVTVNAPMTHDASGYAIDAVSGSVVCGRFLESSSTAGDIVTAIVFPPVRWGSVA